MALNLLRDLALTTGAVGLTSATPLRKFFGSLVAFATLTGLALGKVAIERRATVLETTGSALSMAAGLTEEAIAS